MQQATQSQKVMMDKIALLMSENLLPDKDGRRGDAFEFDEQIGKLIPAFADQGLQLETVLWQEAPEKAADYALMMPLMVWDYAQGKRREFLTAMAKIASKTQLLNGYDVLEWNTDKHYLEVLAKKGAPVISTLSVDGVTKAGIARAFETLKTDHIVIKPRIGAGAWRQVSLKLGDPLPSASELPPGAALIQPFQKAVQDEGEYSFLFFGGKFCHAVLKHPRSGDYRIQSLYGGTEETFQPNPAQLSVANRILDVLDFTPLYARVDLLRGRDGKLKLIELELVEPYLYLPHAKGEGAENSGAKMLAKAVRRKVGTVQQRKRA